MATDPALTAALAQIEAGLGGGTLGVAARHAGSGATADYGARTVFPTASTIKIAIVAELFLQAAAGDLDPAQAVTVTAEDQVGGSGVLASLAPGVTLPLTDLATLTLTVSDNLASNLCLRAVGGPEAVNARLRAWGLADTTVHRPIRFALGPDDPPHTATGTPADFLAMLALLPDPVRQRMAQCADTAMLPRYLAVNPFAADLRRDTPPFVVAHKTGAVTGVRNDVGWIRRGDDALEIAVFTQGCPDERWTVENAGCVAVASVARLLTDRWFGA